MSEQSTITVDREKLERAVAELERTARMLERAVAALLDDEPPPGRSAPLQLAPDRRAA